MLLLNQSTVIKPLNIRELDFYQNIPKDIQAFVPKYKGKWRFLSVNFLFQIESILLKKEEKKTFVWRVLVIGLSRKTDK